MSPRGGISSSFQMRDKCRRLDGRLDSGRDVGGAKGAVVRLAAAAGESDGLHSKEANGFVAKAKKCDVRFMKIQLGFK